jgi:hypothetical protein
MSEKVSAAPAEVQPNPEGLNVEYIHIASQEEIERSLDRACDQADIVVVDNVEPDVDIQDRPVTVPNVLFPSELDLNKLSADQRDALEENVMGYPVPNDEVWKTVDRDHVDEVQERQHDTIRRTVKRGLRESSRDVNLVADYEFTKAVEHGAQLRQVVEVGFDDANAMVVANLGDRLLDEEQQRQLVELISSVNELTGGKVGELNPKILIIPHDQMPELSTEVGGGYDAIGICQWNRIILSDMVLDPDASGRHEGDYDAGHPLLVSTLAHELGHAIEGEYPPMGRGSQFEDQVGWTSREYTLDDGTTGKVVGIGSKEERQRITEAEGYPEGTADYDDDGETRPVSWYGYTAQGEDFAETFAAMVLGERVDRVRKSAVNSYIHGGHEDPRLVPQIESVRVLDPNNTEVYGVVPDEIMNRRIKIKLRYSLLPESLRSSYM